MKKINIILVSIFSIFLILTTNFTSNGANIITNDKQNDRNNNLLESLAVEGYELYPEFNKNIQNYYIIVEDSVTSVDVVAETENPNAKVKITGNTNLNKNENSINIRVTSESNKSKTYTIIATKQKPNELYLTSLSIDGTEISNEFDSLKFYYTLDYKTDKDFTDINVKAVANTDECEIEILGNKDLQSGDNLVTIILRDSKNITIYQVLINVTVEKIIITETKNNNIDSFFLEVKEFFSNKNKVIALLSVIAFILLILILYTIIKIIKNNRANKNRERLRKRIK